MKINKTTMIELTDKDVEEAIKLYLKSKEIDTENVEIQFNIKKKQWTEGHGLMEMDYERIVFEGVTVKTK